MESEAQPTPAETTGELDHDVAAPSISPADPARIGLDATLLSEGSEKIDAQAASVVVEPSPPSNASNASTASTAPATPSALSGLSTLSTYGVASGQSATSTLHSAADPERPLPPTMTPLPEHDPGEPFRPASITFLVVVTVVSLAADLVSKHFAKSNLSGLDSKTRSMHRFEVWKDHVDFIFAQNPGGAWSFLRGLPDTLRRPFFLVVSAAAIVFIISIYRRIGRDQRAMKWGLPLALGGAMGNLVDRMRYGWVVDFVDIYIKRMGREHHWPTFNVADIAIVVGVGLMAIDMLWIRGRKPRSTELQPHVSSP
jgi:signal peptidase II